MKRPSNITPHQREMSRVSLEDLMSKADALPDMSPPRQPQDLLPIVYLLKAKGYFWTEIKEWLKENTEFDRSPTFWKKLHDENPRIKSTNIKTEINNA